jgi:hypothetical protein
LRHGRLYPTAIGQTHTSRLAAGLLSAGVSMPSASEGPSWARAVCLRREGVVRPAEERSQLTTLSGLQLR